MKKIIFIALYILCMLPLLQAQKEMNWWHFGDYSGFTFSNLTTKNSDAGVSTSGLPTPVVGPFKTSEGCFTLSDRNGNLLMSSDGINVYDRNGTLMPNGAGLGGDSSSTQSGIVVPFPGDNTKYYIIAIGITATSAPRYSIVDMTLRGGLGNVTTKAQSLGVGTGENIAAVAHSNGRDYWIVHRGGNQRFYVWELTSSGFSAPKSYTSALLPTGWDAGELIFSPDNKKIAYFTYVGTHYIYSADFNTTTGAISDIRRKAVSDNIYAGAFSASSEYLYIGGNVTRAFKIRWDDLRNGVNPTQLGFTAFNFRLGPDKRIYGIQRPKNLIVIMDPDNGAADIRIFSNYLTNNANAGLPTFMMSFFNLKITELPFVCTNYEHKYSIDIDILGADIPSYLEWDFGDGAPVIQQNYISGISTYSQPYTYNNAQDYTITVSLKRANNTEIEKVTIPAHIVDCVIKTNPMIRTDLVNSKK